MTFAFSKTNKTKIEILEKKMTYGYLKIFSEFSPQNKKENAKLKMNITLDKKALQNINVEYEFYENRSAFISFEDVNFDGNKDILVFLGYAGNQGASIYKAYLWNPEIKNFVLNETYETILNPDIDDFSKMISSSSRGNAYTYYQERFKFIDEDFKLIWRCTTIYSLSNISDLESIYELKIPENVDTEEYILKHFGFLKYIENFKKGETDNFQIIIEEIFDGETSKRLPPKIEVSNMEDLS